MGQLVHLLWEIERRVSTRESMRQCKASVIGGLLHRAGRLMPVRFRCSPLGPVAWRVFHARMGLREQERLPRMYR